MNRIQPTPSMQHHYPPQWLGFFEALLRDIFAMWRTICHLDAVKFVAVDLDDTLWRGIAAEGTLGILEGWPMGFMETLVLLKKRGILLAIVSRNDEHFNNQTRTKSCKARFPWTISSFAKSILAARHRTWPKSSPP